MKYKDIFLATVVSFVAVGCGDSGNTEEAIEDEKDYGFHELIGGAQTVSQTISKEFKDMLRGVWTNLSAKGFSGYDVANLDKELTYSYISGPISPGSGYYHQTRLPQTNNDFHINVYQLVNFGAPILWRRVFSDFNYNKNNVRLQADERDFSIQDVKLDYTTTLIGLKFKDKALTIVYNPESKKYEIVLADEFRNPDSDQKSNRPISEKIDSDILVTQAQVDEWEQVFIDALKEYNKAAILSDGSGSVSLLGARRGHTGTDTKRFHVNGVTGSKVDLGLPFYVQLKGEVNHGKSTDLTNGAVAYKVGNTVVGAIQSYANSGTRFGAKGRQLETSLVASHSFGLLFIEGQLGSVSATDVRLKDWSGVRSQLTLGLDTAWVSPFVQLAKRDFGDRTDTATYAGLEVDLSEVKADSYSFSTYLLAKVGHHSVHGMTGAVEWSGSFNLNNGLSFTTNLALRTVADSSVGLNFTLDR